jgi:predicted  nucleic acid-binding Zn-ribbon protein
MVVNSKLSVSQAAKAWNISRQTIYKYIRDGRLSKNDNGTVSIVEMVRVFGEKKPSVSDTQQITVNDRQEMNSLQGEVTTLKKQLEFLTNEIEQYKIREEWYRQQIEQLQPKRIEDKSKKSFLSRLLR